MNSTPNQQQTAYSQINTHHRLFLGADQHLRQRRVGDRVRPQRQRAVRKLRAAIQVLEREVAHGGGAAAVRMKRYFVIEIYI